MARQLVNVEVDAKYFGNNSKRFAVPYYSTMGTLTFLLELLNYSTTKYVFSDKLFAYRLLF